MSPTPPPGPEGRKSQGPPEPGRPRAGPPGLPPLGKYALVRELGRGGMGIVYEALDTALERRVALKMMRANPDADPEETRQEEERFLREARLGASLEKHPNLVAVYEAGVIDGRRYIAMELIDGQPMSDWRKSGSVTVRQQVTLLRDTALAVHHAHAAGIIHRDLKPQNILVDAKGRPHVTDLGLSKKTGQGAELSLSVTGVVVGTPAYMSPEQAQGLKSIDGRTDIYAMGVMLYEILTGRTPFGGQTAVEILVKVVKNPVVPPSAVLKKAAVAVDRELEKVCLKALAKSARDRYASAKDFADDLGRWLKGEEIQVTPPTMTVPATLQPGAKRKRILWISAGAGAAVILAAVAFVAVPSSADRQLRFNLAQAKRMMDEKNFAEAADAYERILRRDPENAEALEGKAQAKAAVDKAEQAARQKAEKARAEEARAREEDRKKRDAEARAADADFAKATEIAKVEAEARKKELEAERLRAEEERSRAEAVKRAAESQGAKPAPALEPAARTPLGRPLKGHTGAVLAVAFSPDGSLVATAGIDRTARVWDRASGRPLQVFQGHGSDVSGVAFDASGPRVASCSLDGTIHLWDRESGAEIRSFAAHAGGVDSIAYSPDGKLLVSGGRDRKIKLWDPATGKDVRTLTGHVMPVLSVAFSPDGKLIASGAADSYIRLWETQTGKQLHSFTGHLHQVRSVAFGPGSKLLVSGAVDGTVKLWSVLTGRELRPLAGHSDEVTGVAFDPGGRFAVSSGRDGTIKIWDVATGKELRAAAGQGGRINGVALGPERAAVAWASQGGVGFLSVADLALSPRAVSWPREDRLPVPDPAKQRVAEKKVRDANKAEYASKAPAELKALADKLYRQGLLALDDLSDRYALLREARDVALQAGDPALAVAAIDELDESFALDGLALKAEALGKVPIAGRGADEARALAALYLKFLDEAVREDDYEKAKAAFSRAEFAAKAAKDEALAAHVQSRLREVGQIQAEYQRAKAAAPDNAADLLAAGRFWCLVKGDAEKGLPLLAKGSDPALKSLAELEQAPPADADAALERVDAWIRLAESEQGLSRRGAASRAAAWYRSVAPALGADVREKTEARLKGL